MLPGTLVEKFCQVRRRCEFFLGLRGLVGRA